MNWRSILEKSAYWFLKSTKKDKEDNVVQAGVLITCLGIEGARIYDSFVFADQADKLKIQPVLHAFDGHFRRARRHFM